MIVGLVIEFVDLITDFTVYNPFLAFASDVVNTFLAVFFFDIFEALRVTHDGVGRAVKNLITNIFYLNLIFFIAYVENSHLFTKSIE